MIEIKEYSEAPVPFSEIERCDPFKIDAENPNLDGEYFYYIKAKTPNGDLAFCVSTGEIEPFEDDVMVIPIHKASFIVQ